MGRYTDALFKFEVGQKVYVKCIHGGARLNLPVVIVKRFRYAALSWYEAQSLYWDKPVEFHEGQLFTEKPYVGDAEGPQEKEAPEQPGDPQP